MVSGGVGSGFGQSRASLATGVVGERYWIWRVVGERYWIWRDHGRVLLDLEGSWESITGFGRDGTVSHDWFERWGAHHMIFLQKVFHCLVNTQIWSAHPNWAISGTPNADCFPPLFA